MSYIGDEEDVEILHHGNQDKLRFAALTFYHSDHDFIPADNPRGLAIGFACIDCNESWDLPISEISKSSGNQRVDDFLLDICKFSDHRTPKGMAGVIERHPEASVKLKKICCLM